MKLSNPRFIIIHHTAGHDQPITDIDRLHRDWGWGDPVTDAKLAADYIRRGFPVHPQGALVSVGYHRYIRPDGKVEVGRPDDMVGAHCRAGSMNMQSLAVCLAGNFDAVDNPDGRRGPLYPTVSQLNSLLTVCCQWMSRYGIPLEHVLFHDDVPGANTACPGSRFPKVQFIQKLTIKLRQL